MIKELLKNILVSFVFGCMIALIAFFGNFPIPLHYILIMPFFMAAINLVGSGAAMVVLIILSLKNLVREKLLNVIGFLTAAIVNTVIALSVIFRLEETFLHSELIFLYFTGMALGVVYSVYRYRQQLMNERVRFLEEIALKNRQLQEASRQLAITTERDRMGRDLHDSISQGLHGLIYLIHSLRNQLSDPAPDVRKTLDHMEATARSTQDELRAMIEALQPSLLVKEGLEQAIRDLAALFSQRHGIPAELEITLPEEIGAQAEMALYRITQEALANIEKHAGAAKVTLSLQPLPLQGSSSYTMDHTSQEQTVQGQLQLTIKDNGRGFDSKVLSSGHGLRNMRLRAEEAGGSLTIVSRPNLGTSVIAVLPIG